MSILYFLYTLIGLLVITIALNVTIYIIDKRKYPVVKRTQVQTKLPSKPLTDREKVILLKKQIRALKTLFVISFFLLFILFLFLFFLLNIAK